SSKTVLSNGSSRLTTRDIQREHEKMLRSQNVKERIGPIVDRLKTSLSKIEAIEQSMEKIQHPQQPQQDAQETQRPKLMSPGKSKELMHSSIELVKRKLLRLRRMEETLSISEDRRHTLQHQILQVSLSKPSLDLAATKRQNAHLTNQVDELQQQNEILRAKSELVDDLQHQNDSLLIKIDELVHAKGQLEQTRKERDILKEDLMQRQAKISQQADKCDDLECQVEHMKVLCDEMMSSLKQQEDRNAELEQELVETRKAGRRERSQPPIVQLLESKESVVTEMTSSSLSEALNREDDNSFDSSFSTSSASAIILNTSIGLDEDSRSRGHLASHMLCRAKKGGLEEDTQSSMLETLMATIEVLDRENAQLREEKHHAIGKYKAQNHQMERQADTIRDLKVRSKNPGTPRSTKTVDIVLSSIGENGRPGDEATGSFYHRLLSKKEVSGT
ncbi:MAG: hypothetical protein SGILL_005499, partial [Bacillariaceae sp.]